MEAAAKYPLRRRAVIQQSPMLTEEARSLPFTGPRHLARAHQDTRVHLALTTDRAPDMSRPTFDEEKRDSDYEYQYEEQQTTPEQRCPPPRLLRPGANFAHDSIITPSRGLSTAQRRFGTDWQALGISSR